MQKKLLVLLVIAGPILVLSAAGVAPVGALSCAAHPDGSPEAIASGAERLSSEASFFDSYDYAVIGTVGEIHTVEAGAPDYGATTLTVDVVAVLGEGPTQQSLAISSPDPGWMAGYPYEAGATYFVPVQRTGPEGQPNYSFVCDPITEVDASITSEIRQLAANAGIPFSTPDVAPVLVPTPEPDDNEHAAVAASSGWALPGAAAALTVGAAVIVGGTALRARRQAAPAPS